MNNNDENTDELLSKFFGAEQARQISEDIERGEQILREHPAPKPGERLIADIKANIPDALLSRKTITFKRTVYKALAVAAVLIFAAIITVNSFEKDTLRYQPAVTASIIPREIWESDNLAADDEDLAILTAEIKQIETETLAAQFGENGGNGYDAVAELEVELIEIDSDFWKG